MKNKMFVVLLMLVNVFGLIYIKDNIKYSNSKEVISYNNDYEIGSIKISSINLDRKIMQGLDNEYYFTHNYLNADSDSGEFFLDTFSDLNRSDAIIYSSVNNLDVNLLRINDKVSINYIDNELCYKIDSINNNIKRDLIIKLVSTNKEYNIFLSRIDC